ncbi:MAG: radical SAM protein, partial [bacterium]|nr:radical SAM protein [bacterium]
LWATDELCDARRELYRDVVFGIAEGRRPSATPRTEVSVHAPGPRTVADAAVEEHDGEYVLLHPERASYLVTNEAGLRAYRLADGTRTTAEILEGLSEELEIPVSELEAPIHSFFREVKLSGFVARPGAARRPVDRPAHALPVRVRSLFFHVTDLCNINCTHCYRASGPSRPEENAELSKERIFELVDELVELGGRKITFTGGEPLARRDCLEILRYAGVRVKLTLLTNAMLIDERIARALAELPISVQVSLDGSTPEVHDAIRGRGGFERTLGGIAHLKAAGLGPKMSISASMLRSNLHDLLNLIPLVEQLELPELRFMPLHELGRAQHNWPRIAPTHDEYLAFYRKLYFEGYASHPTIHVNTGFSGLVFPSSRNDPGHSWCPIGRVVTLKPNGDAYACALMMQDEDYIGNVRGRSLGELQDSHGLKKAADDVARRRQVIAKCRACNWRHFCQGSCTGLARIKAGAIWATDAFCDLRRDIYRRKVSGPQPPETRRQILTKPKRSPGSQSSGSESCSVPTERRAQ